MALLDIRFCIEKRTFWTNEATVYLTKGRVDKQEVIRQRTNTQLIDGFGMEQKKQMPTFRDLELSIAIARNIQNPVCNTYTILFLNKKIVQ